LVKRGLKGVRLVISDAQEGLKQAISTVLTGSTWQRCRVHFMRNLLATVPQGAREAIAAIVRTIFAQPDHASAMTQLRKVAEGLRLRFPRAATVLEDAAEDILAYRHLPVEHQRQLHSTNPLERLNKEIKRRSNVVGIFPNPAAVIRLVGAILIEQDDEWAVADPPRRRHRGPRRGLPSRRVVSTISKASWRSGKAARTRTLRVRPGLKIRNAAYTQSDGRRELFERGRDNRQRRERWVRPQVVLG
jgi:hypothetical protein